MGSGNDTHERGDMSWQAELVGTRECESMSIRPPVIHTGCIVVVMSRRQPLDS